MLDINLQMCDCVCLSGDNMLRPCRCVIAGLYTHLLNRLIGLRNLGVSYQCTTIFTV